VINGPRSESITGFIFVGKLQQLAITQISFDPVTTLKPAFIGRQDVQENSLRTVAAGSNVFQTRCDETPKQLEIITGKENLGQKHGCVTVGRSCLTDLGYVHQAHEHISL
jgi:hypothetical protein